MIGQTVFKLKDLEYNDVMLYFKGSFVRLLNYAAKPTWMQLYNGVGDYALQFKEDATIHTIEPPAWKKLQIDSVFPFGFFNTKTSAFFFYRVPARMNTKGLWFGHNVKAVRLETILSKIGIGGELPEKQKALWHTAMLDSGIPIQSSFFNWAFESGDRDSEFDSKLAEVFSGKAVGRALAMNFAVSVHPREMGLVWYNTLPVGEFVSSKKIRCLNPHFRQELHDFFHPLNITVKS